MPEPTPADTGKKLILVDGYSLLFRAFFAGHNFTTSDNRPTGAIFGLTNMLFSLLNTEKPDSIVVCWDAAGPTFRSQEFEAYKAHRPEVDPQLIAQLPTARQLTDAMAIQSIEFQGFEADDLIGTLSKRGEAQGFEVTILTGDSDQLQLVNESVKVRMTQRGVSETKLYDIVAVRERYGIDPERIADWKALVGDTSDNIPGVPGIGEKTATALLKRWGSLEEILAHLDEVTPPKAKNALTANFEQARFSLRLATIVCDVPCELEILPYAPTVDDWKRCRDFFADLEFRSLLARVEKMIPEGEGGTIQTSTQPLSVEVVQVTSAPLLEEVVQAALNSEVVAMVPHLTNALPMLAELHGITLAFTDDKAYTLTFETNSVPQENIGGLFETGSEGKEFSPTLDAIKPLLESPTVAKIGHDVKKFEIVLEQAGLKPTPWLFDTMLAAYLINAGRSDYPLSELIENHLNASLPPANPQETFRAHEAVGIFKLYPVLKDVLAKDGMREVMEKVDMPLIPALATLERNGILIDTPYLTTLANRMATQIEAIAKEIYAIAGEEFNIGSPKQLQTILFDKMQLPTGKKTKTGYSTGADLLESLAPQYEIAQKIIDWREMTKLKATYADVLPRQTHPITRRIHTSLNQAVASSGRLSSSDPNLQNIPIRSEVGREIRRAFIAQPGTLLLSCDYSQIELRVLAHITKDSSLLEAFTSDADVHAATASKVFGVALTEVTPEQRRQAKTINFAVIYGQSGFSLAPTLGVSASVANTWIKEYFERLPGVKLFVEETTAMAHQQKFVTTLMGRRRYLPELDSSSHSIRQYAERAAVNMPIQGTAADIMKLAMIDVHAYLQTTPNSGCQLILQIHDELLFEVEEDRIPEVTTQITELMERAYPLDVRLKADAKFGSNWTDMRSVF